MLAYQNLYTMNVKIIAPQQTIYYRILTKVEVYSVNMQYNGYIC